MKKRVVWFFLVAVLWLFAELAAFAIEDIPVYGAARVAIEDADLLEKTVLEVGVLATTPDNPTRVVIGDGITPGGREIHPTGCVTQFNQIANATTNLNMHSYSITFGPWAMSGGLDEFGLTWGGSETWLRLVRDTGIAFLSYDFTIIDAEHYRFELVWTGEGYDFPVLMVSTNLLQGYAAADPADVSYSRPDVSHLVVEYTAPEDCEFIAFQFFAPDRMKTGAYFSVPVHADYGLAAVGSLSVTGRVESYYDENAEENRDRYVPGSITIDGEEVATTGAVAAVAADLATHAGDTDNPHAVTFAQVLEADEDGMRDDFGMSFSGGDGISALSGFGRTIEVETGAFLGDWHFDERPNVGTNGLATVADVEGVADDLAAHEADTNAHAAAIKNYLASHGIEADPYFGNPASNDGVECLAGWGNYFSFELSQWWRPIGTDFIFWATNSTWVFRTPTRPRWRRDVGGQSEEFGLATTNDIALHEARQDNPHAVTADQTGAIPATRGPLGTYLVSDDVIFDGGVSTEGAASVGGDLVVGGSLTVGLGTTTNLSELATAASVSAVSDRVGDIEDDYLTSEDAAGFATTGAVASVERRIATLEDGETYYCRWSSVDVSATRTNWIPTANWPSTDIDLQVYPGSCSNLVIGIRGEWEPTNRVHIAVTLTRSTSAIPEGGAPGGIYIGSNSISTFPTSSVRRRWDFTWCPESKLWMLNVVSLIYQNNAFNSSGASKPAYLPNDVFLPEFDE